MEKAFDIVVKDTISAENAKREESFRYRCPYCGKYVFIKGGYNIQRASFSHYPGEGSPECENYHLPTSYGLVSKFFKARTPNLYLIVPNPYAPMPQWLIELLIPANLFNQTGTITINQAIRGTVTIPCSALRNKGESVSVKLQEESYQLELSTDIAADYNHKLNPTPGLDKDNLNVFHFSLKGGRRLTKEEDLIWGKGYYIVWHQDFKVDWSSKIWKRMLKKIEEWNCAEIELPSKFDAEVECWVKRFLNRKIKLQSIFLTLISPSGFIEQNDGSLLINENYEVLLGIMGNNETIPTGVIYIDLPDDRLEYINLPSELPAIVSLGQLPKGRTIVWLSKVPEANLTIVSETFKSDLKQPEVRFIIYDKMKNGKEEYPAYSQLTRKALEKVLKKENDLLGINIPKRAHFSATVKYMKNGMIQSRLIDLFSNLDYSECFKDHHGFEEYICQTVNSILKKSINSVFFDFGNYGRPYIGINSVRPIESDSLKLPSEIRDRICWLINLPLNKNPVKHYSPLIEIKYLAECLKRNPRIKIVEKDYLLIKELVQKPFWPTNAEPYLRFLIKEIANFLSSQQCKTTKN